MLSQQEEVDEPVDEAEQPEEGEGGEATTTDEEEGADEETEEDDPYATAEIVEPVDDKNIAIHEDVGAVLGEVFEEEPKLVETGGITRASYVVDRVITSDDVLEIKDLLAEKGYETRNSSTEGDKYELDLSISEDVLEEKYDGDPGGNMYLNIWTAEEGENAQRIQVETL